MTDKEKPNEIRKDFLGREVIIALNRGKRPQEFVCQKHVKTTPPEKCFFCPGNEHLTPPEIDRIESAPGKWQIRCFPNKFAAVSKAWKKAYGSHEIIVETPDHQKTLSELDEGNIFNAIEMFCRRVRAAAEDPKTKYAMLFKNEGLEGGASLEHTHCQLVTLPRVPPLVKKESRKFKEGKCALCKSIEKERRRTFFEDANFVAYMPKASRFHFETWVVPKRHARSILDLTEAERRSLATALKVMLGKLDQHVGYPPYNMVFHTAPFDNSPFHFHIELLPRLSKLAGFEFGTEMIMNSLPPEMAADEFRK